MQVVHEIIKNLSQKKIKIKLDDSQNKIIVSGDTKRLTDGDKVRISQNKEELIKMLKVSRSSNTMEFKPIHPVATSESYALSNGQLRLWILSQFEKGSQVYHLPYQIPLEGNYNIDHFKQAIYNTIERHEILRTIFKENDQGEIRQWILEPEELGFKIDFQDFRSDLNSEEKISNYIQLDRQRAFNLEQGPLLRAALLQQTDTKYVFYYNMHHIISDGWSMGLLASDVLSYYQALEADQEAALPKLGIQYKDYADWQLNQLDAPEFQDHKDYWLTHLSGEIPLINLPTELQRPKNKTFEGASLHTYISAEQTRSLGEFVEEHGGSLYMGILSLLKVLLFKYTGTTDIVVGSPVSGRNHSDLLNQIGFYINTLALRNQIDPEEDFLSFYNKVKTSTLESLEHQMYPFDKLVDQLEAVTYADRNPVFDVMFVFQNEEDKLETLEVEEAWSESIEFVENQGAKLDIGIIVKEVGNGLKFTVNYNTAIYERPMLERFIENFRTLMQTALEPRSIPLKQISCIAPSERQQLLIHFNETKLDFPEHRTVLDLFDDQVKNTPNAMAIAFDGKELTYKELDDKANKLGHYLMSALLVEAEDFVGVLLDRSDWLVVSLLSVFKIGATYVPMDPNNPEERIKHMQNDSKCKAIIDASVIEDFEVSKEIHPTTHLNRSISSNLAYVIYTSGSTGKPKGVMIAHDALYNSTMARFNFYEDYGNTLLVISPAFDVAYAVIFGTLLKGGKLILVSKKDMYDPQFMERTFEGQALNTLFCPNHYYQFLLAECQLDRSALRTLISGGEKMSDALKEEILSFSDARLFNEYGPTETTIWSSAANFNLGEVNSIGKPIANTTYYITNDSGQLVPMGVAGELLIGGAQLARGYLNLEELTQERFIQNPFDPSGEGKVYRTGDLAKWLEDGSIQFLGRIDDQVKIRGYRIELGEVESTLQQKEGIIETVVIAKENQSGVHELVAYVVSEEEENTNDLREHLSQQLADYMIPSYFVQLNELPLTPNGKVDKRALPNPEVMELFTGVAYVAPRTLEEEILTEVWQEVLRKEVVSVKDSFYSLGGDSIKSIQIVSRMKQKGYYLSLEEIMGNPVLEDLAKSVVPDKRLIDQSAVEGEVILTPIQHYFFNSPKVKVPHHYNQSVLLKSAEPIDSKALEQSIEALVNHHDALRMTYSISEAAVKQMNKPISAKAYEIQYHDLSEDKNATQTLEELGGALQSSIQLDTGPLVKVGHFRLADGDRLALVIHHLVIDGISWRIILDDLLNLYYHYTTDNDWSLPLKTDSFQRWAQLQYEYANGVQMADERLYWEAICSENVPMIPQDMDTAEEVVHHDAARSFALDTATTELLQTKVHRVYQTEINDLLLTALGMAVHEVFELDRVAVEMEGHGREKFMEDLDVSRTIGWFTSTYPFVMDFSQAGTQRECLIQIKEDLRKIPNKGISYGMLKWLTEDSLGTLNPSIIFNYLGDFGDRPEASSQSTFDYASESIGPEMDKSNGEVIPLNVSGMMVSGQLTMTIGYANSQFKNETIERLLTAFREHLTQFIQELSAEEKTYITPSDLTFSGLSMVEVTALNAQHNIEDIYTLSPLQEGMYYHWLLGSSSSLYFSQTSYRLNAASYSVEQIKRAYDQLIERYAILRTSFVNEFSEPLQLVHKEVASSFSYEALDTGLDQEAREAYIEQTKVKDRELGFDLKGTSQMRLKILDLGGGFYEFIWSHHHILMDGWCIGILINDFYQLLKGIKSGIPVTLAKPTPYANYIKWITAVDQKASLHYWSAYLEGYNSTVEVPFKNENGTSQEYSEVKKTFFIKDQLYAKVKKLCNDLEITQNTFIQAIWGVLLSKYNCTQDVVFGSVVSGRPSNLAGVENMIGLFINTVPVRVEYDDATRPVDLLKSMHQMGIENNAHHYTNLSMIQAQTEIGKDLIDHIMSFQNYLKQDSPEVVNPSETEEQLLVESSEIIDQSNYDFNIRIAVAEQSMMVEFKYNENRYDNDGVESLMRHFYTLAEQFTLRSEAAILSLDYLTSEEEHTILEDFNDTKVDLPMDRTVIDVFKDQVAETPDRIAINFEDRSYTYRQLDELSNRLAHCLKEDYNLSIGDFVGIQLDRNEWQIISILGVLKAGGAYVPIVPQYPADRKEYMIKDSEMDLLITDTNYMFDMDYFEGTILAIDVEFEADAYSDQPLELGITTSDLVHIMYTSGSTGTPKGVMIDHKNIVHLVKSGNYYDFTSLDTVLTTGSFSFDASTFEFFGSLLNGATLIITTRHTLLDVELLATEMKVKEVNVMFFTTAWLNQLVDTNINLFKSLKKVMFGGDRLSTTHITKLREAYPDLELINCYGPTEGTTFSLTYKITKAFANNPIGYPIFNSSVVLLDDHQQLVPTGIIGEICLGGNGLAQGYLNQSQLTKENFIEHPYHKGTLLYQTGDLGRWTKEGCVEFIGRKDNQVKIRGHRVELGGIEFQLENISEIQESVVLALDSEGGDKQLVAYIVLEEPLDSTGIQEKLQDKLPDYMIPRLFVPLDVFPMTQNGKVDRKALPSPEGIELSAGHVYVAPRDETEEALVSVWQEHLSLGKVGVQDDYYQLGGDSIKMIRLISIVNKQFDVKFPLAKFHENPTVAGMAGFILKPEEVVFSSFELTLEIEAQISALELAVLENHPNPHNIANVYPMSDIQMGMVFTSKLMRENQEFGVYHTQVSLHVGLVDVDRLRQAMALMAQKHECFRTSFDLYEYDKPVQIIHKKVPVVIGFEDINYLAPEERAGHIQKFLDDEIVNHPFNFNEAPLWRINIFKMSPKDMIFALQMHHSIIDGWGDNNFKEELFLIYNALEQNKNFRPNLLKCSIRDSVISDYLETRNEDNIEYWKSKMSDYQRLQIFGDKWVEEGYSKIFTNEMNRTVLDKCKRDGITPKALFFAAYLYTLHLFSSEKDMTIGLVANNRPVVEDGDRLLGCFLNTVPFRFDMSLIDQYSWEEYVQLIEHDMKEMKGKDRFSLYQISNLVEENSPSNPFFDVMFNYVDFHQLAEFYENEDLQAFNADRQEVEFSIKDFDKGNTFLDCAVSLTSSGIVISSSLVRNLRSNHQLADLMLYMENFLDQYLNHGHTSVSGTSIIPESEKGKIIKSFNETEVLIPKDHTLVDLFTQQVERTPKAVALVFGDKKITYRELDEQSDQLAHYVQFYQDIQPEDLIGVCLERDEWLIISLLAVLKTGAAYVPIAIDFPKERVDFILKDGDCKLMIDKTFLKDFQANTTAAEVVLNVPKPNQLAYVIYTSGSTGKPKGVMVEHSNAVSFLNSSCEHLGWCNFDIVAATTNVTFDISFLEIFGALCHGKQLILFSEEELLNPQLFVARIIQNKIEALQITPSRLTQLQEELLSSRPPSLRHILVGGEPFPITLFDNKSAFKDIRIINVYGPTETTVWSTSLDIQSSEKLNIGKPLPNEKAYILSDTLELVPFGAEGELCISGDGVTRGYLNLPKLTAEKFVENPFVEGERLYRTGDLAKWLPDGNLAFLGRRDDQVKVRGHRIELGEIEHHLRTKDDISDAVVLLSNGENEMQDLVAYVATNEAQDTTGLRTYLLSKLPDYMVPAHFVALPELPLLPSGKVNKKELQEMEGEVIQSGAEYLAPQTRNEKVLVGVCQEVLKTHVLGINDNLFDVGANSIKILQIIGKLKKIGFTLSIREIYDTPVIALLAHQLTAVKETIETISFDSFSDQWEVGETLVVSPNQYRFLRQEQSSVVFSSLIPALAPEAFEMKFRLFLKDFPFLCVAFEKASGSVLQRRVASEEVKLELFVASSYETAQSTIAQYSEEAFNLYEGALIRALLITSTEEKQGTLLVSIHHSLLDDYTSRVVNSALEEFFSVGELTKSHQGPSQFIRWQHEFLTSPAGVDKRTFWAHILKPEETFKQNEQPTVDLSNSLHQEILIQGKELQQIKALVAHLNLPVNAFFMAAHQQWLLELEAVSGYLQGVTVNGREQTQGGENMGQILGVIDNLLPIPYTRSSKVFDTERVREIYMNYLEIREHQEIPYEILRADFDRDHQMDLEQSISGSFNFREFPDVNSGVLEDNLEIKIWKDARVYDYPTIDLVCMAYEDLLKIRISMPHALYNKNKKQWSLDYLLDKIRGLLK
ncbi:MAG: amino acid adenylation domain-containing protein [Bacteroidota bacterium]